MGRVIAGVCGVKGVRKAADVKESRCVLLALLAVTAAEDSCEQHQ